MNGDAIANSDETRPWGPMETDCVIVGGGVIGLSLAYELAGRGIATTLIDSQSTGREASWAGAGMLPPGSWYAGDGAMEELAALSGELNRRWSKQLYDLTGINNELTTCGGLYVASSDEQLARFAAVFSRWADLGVTVERIDAVRLAQLEPNIGESSRGHAEIRGGYYIPSEGQLRNPRHLEALSKGCRARGARVMTSCHTHSLETADNKICAIITDRGRIACNQVVLAAGAWSGRLAEAWGFRLPVHPVRGQILLYPPQDPPLFRNNIHVDDYYLVPRRDGRILVGATVEAAGFDRSNTLEGIESLKQWAEAVSPRFKGLSLERTWAGLRPASPDGLPYIGRAPCYGNLWVAAGHYRSGLQFASATAFVLADHLTGQPSLIDIHPFRLDR